jgi:uncharacterized cupin superfamily protein
MHVMNLFDPTGFVELMNQEKYKSNFKEMSIDFGAKKLGFHIRSMDPKTFTYPYHWHTAEEEVIIIIEGEATVRCNNQFRIVKPGDFIFYNTGPENVHQMYNHTDKICKFLALSNMDEVNDQCFYPDSKKQTSKEGILQDGKIVEYFKDEEDPSIYWPKEKL